VRLEIEFGGIDWELWVLSPAPLNAFEQFHSFVS